MTKTLTAVLAGNGPGCKYDEPKYQNVFWSNDKQDVIAFTDFRDHANWKPKNFSVVHNGMPYENTASNMASLKNYVLNWAEEHGYERVWMFDDNIARICKYGPYTKADFDRNITVPYIRWPELPEIDQPYGGMAGSNFIKNRIWRPGMYNGMSPISIHYWHIPMLKELCGGKVPLHTTDVMMWEDYDYLLTLLSYGIKPKTFREYAGQKGSSQDERVKKGSFFSTGAEKTIMLGYNLYVKWGSENTMGMRKVNMADIVIRRGIKKVGPIKHRWRIDSLDNFLQDILDERETYYCRDSSRGKTQGYEWTSLIKNAAPKEFKFGV